MTFRGAPQLPHLGEEERSAERSGRRWTAAALLCFAVWVALGTHAVPLGTQDPAFAQSPEPQTTLPDVEDEVMCPVCGTTLELASDAQQAIREREFIRGLIADGRSKEEIKDALVGEFGDEVLALPDDEGFDLAAWIVPGLAIIAAAVAIFLALRRWRGASDGDGPGPDPKPLDAEDAGRLEADLERYGR